MSAELDFLSMSTVMLRMRLRPAAIAMLMVLRRAGDELEVWEVVKLGGVSATVAYRTLLYLEQKGMTRHLLRKDAYRRTVSVWGLTRKGKATVDGLEVMYRRVVQEWERRWRIEKGGRTDG